ncbi:hypothetical protein V5O48_016202 [Marasmius crinis-equi]|uniref:FAD/NAD(P)-binding domain-containing protein n=1 Tax=Marasmius crinis-equi TaxID=585013 RepID=A0ABR3ESC6_9AGAR
MVRFSQYVFSVLPLSSSFSKAPKPTYVGNLNAFSVHDHLPTYAKSIAIVGSGSAGLAILKSLLDLPSDVRAGWDIVLFEQRRDVGGIWLPDFNPPSPPALPETPLYPQLMTNTPHPTMTYPGFPFPPNTPLFPRHEYVEQYHVDYASYHNLTQFIRLNHTVHAAGWLGNNTHGQWDLEIHQTSGNAIPVKIRRKFDHLVVANGHNHYPRVPHWDGVSDWLSHSPLGAPKRELLHSIFYRGPDQYKNATVVIVGSGASGRDAALQVGSVAKKAYQSLREGADPTPGANVTAKPTISHFNFTSVIFSDGSSLESVDAVISATGYQYLVPFLTRAPSDSNANSVFVTSPDTDRNCTTATSLITNTRYIFPLYQHIFSLSPNLPPTALSFVGLPVLIANCPSDVAQALLLSHALADPSVLPSRQRMLEDLIKRENHLRSLGYDPYQVGHKLVGGDTEAQDYQDELVEYLKTKKKLPDDGKKFVEQWRRDSRKYSFLLKRAWDRVVAIGEEDAWLDGVESEDQWADMMTRLAKWQEEWEEGGGIDIAP